tara:strand:- start:285902 stop:286318 length:417 start_codon:yes stop_codon:yes gene_type:complete
MNKIILFFILTTSFAMAQVSSTTSLGFKIGSDTGLNFRTPVQGEEFIQTTLGTDNDDLFINATYNTFLKPFRATVPYVGFGAGIETDEDDSDTANLRLPLGLVYEIPNRRLFTYAEVTGVVGNETSGAELHLGLNYSF